jgi:hypothetical protein
VEGKTLAAAVVLVALTVMGVGMAALYAGGPPPAPPRPAPASEQSSAEGDLRFSPMVYRGQVEQDARSFGVAPPAAGEMEAPFLYAEEHKGRRKLTPKQPIDTPHLRLALDVEKHQATLEGHSFRYEHLVLRIENRTPKYLAYRIITEVPDRKKCSSKGDIPHNAIVIEPHQILRRTECLFRTHTSVDVMRVEVVELPALGAVYASRLPATNVLYDSRTAAGHVPLKGSLCPQTFSWREIQDGVDSKQIDWRDVIDYYARHSCEEYAFFKAYRFRSDPAGPLPARPPPE